VSADASGVPLTPARDTPIPTANATATNAALNLLFLETTGSSPLQFSLVL
jgi:hypothetical protein